MVSMVSLSVSAVSPGAPAIKYHKIGSLVLTTFSFSLFGYINEKQMNPTMNQIASDAVIDEAYKWLCKRRKDYHHNKNRPQSPICQYRSGTAPIRYEHYVQGGRPWFHPT